jgi:hypothetical protein
VSVQRGQLFEDTCPQLRCRQRRADLRKVHAGAPPSKRVWIARACRTTSPSSSASSVVASGSRTCGSATTLVATILFAHQRPGLNWVEIVHATGPAANSRHGETSVDIGRAADVEAEFGEFTRRAGLKHCGSWHSHPRGDGQPSRTDLNVWARRLKETGWSRYINVIATPGDGYGPKLHGWLTRTDGPGRVVCEPITALHHY